ncbi:hypothetical protein [Microbispora sp. NPDC049125]|uniref:hypothetical protein n=1 Tax=Microbispora sp. NPDC049125 TaxID=3154929 RepID=UPI0034657E31
MWLDPGEFEVLGYVVHVLFDDFCDADDPSFWLGKSLESPGWPVVLAVAARLAQVLVKNDLAALSGLHEAGHRRPALLPTADA